MDVTILVATYGGNEWVQRARRAIRSARGQAPVIHRHGETLAQARNEALALVDTEWVVHLDADDELEPGYIEAMAAGSADLRYPLIRYVRDGVEEDAAYPRVVNHNHPCRPECLRVGNFIAVGAAVRTQLVRAVGGFREYAWCEDWDLWIRCWKAGASIEGTQAIYRAHVNRQSRNRGATRAVRLAAYEAIRRANFPEEHVVAA